MSDSSQHRGLGTRTLLPAQTADGIKERLDERSEQNMVLQKNVE